ncbi:hypothetical protein Tco_1135915 [Tanacetum coccineum]
MTYSPTSRNSSTGPSGFAPSLEKAECSNYKSLAAKIKLLEATLDMERHHENHKRLLLGAFDVVKYKVKRSKEAISTCKFSCHEKANEHESVKSKCKLKVEKKIDNRWKYAVFSSDEKSKFRLREDGKSNLFWAIKCRVPTSAGASSAHTTDTPSQAPKTSTSSGPTTATTQEKVYSSYLDLELSDVEPCISGPKCTLLLTGHMTELQNLVASLLSSMKLGMANIVPRVFRRALRDIKFKEQTDKKFIPENIHINLVASLLSSMKLGINESPRLANIVPGVFRRALREG